MCYSYLKSLSKDELVSILIPLIEKATKIDDYWASPQDENGLPVGLVEGFDYEEAEDAAAEIWVAMSHFHDDYYPITVRCKK